MSIPTNFLHIDKVNNSHLCFRSVGGNKYSVTRYKENLTITEIILRFLQNLFSCWSEKQWEKHTVKINIGGAQETERTIYLEISDTSKTPQKHLERSANEVSIAHLPSARSTTIIRFQETGDAAKKYSAALTLTGVPRLARECL